jgi:hypothetical protein
MLISFLFVLIISCKNTQQELQVEEVALSASEIIDKSYIFYNVEQLKQNDVSFKFRIHDYNYLRKGSDIVRIRKTIDTNNIEIKDVWKSDVVERFVNDSLIFIESERQEAYRNSINSVFYFAFLPNGLKDPAVNTELMDTVKIKKKEYYKIRVTFDEEGGGEDYNDIFIYWFDKEDFSMDYLAYQYFTEGGGIRFREAINVREIDEITFQDYINYKPSSDSIKLVDIDKAFENNNLKEVSRIELENIKVN